MVELSKEEREERMLYDMYFKSGKPKKKYMLCKDPEYLSEIRRINGYINPNCICGGLRCPFYSVGCDDAGRDWEQ